MLQEIHVVAALLRKEHCIFVQQRGAHQKQPLLWEFPGGKIEKGESPQEALVRECWEELGIHVQPTHVWMETMYAYSDVRVVLCVIEATWDCALPPQPTACAQWKWQPVDRLMELEWCPADIAVVEKIMSSSFK
jgi:8-oxo-dGTP diphosphatase